MARGKRTTIAYWRNHFTAQVASGLSAAQYRRKEGIRSGQWSYWQSKLSIVEASLSPMTLVPIKVEPLGYQEKTLQVNLPNGISVTLTQVDAPVQLLQQLIQLKST